MFRKWLEKRREIGKLEIAVSDKNHEMLDSFSKAFDLLTPKTRVELIKGRNSEELSLNMDKFLSKFHNENRLGFLHSIVEKNFAVENEICYMMVEYKVWELIDENSLVTYQENYHLYEKYKAEHEELEDELNLLRWS